MKKKVKSFFKGWNLEFRGRDYAIFSGVESFYSLHFFSNSNVIMFLFSKIEMSPWICYNVLKKRGHYVGGRESHSEQKGIEEV